MSKPFRDHLSPPWSPVADDCMRDGSRRSNRPAGRHFEITRVDAVLVMGHREPGIRHQRALEVVREWSCRSGTIDAFASAMWNTGAFAMPV